MLQRQLSRGIVRDHAQRTRIATRPFFPPTWCHPPGMPGLLDSDAADRAASDHRRNDCGYFAGPLAAGRAGTRRGGVSFSGSLESDSLRCGAARACALHVCRGPGIPCGSATGTTPLRRLDFLCWHGSAVCTRCAALAVDRKAGRLLRRGHFAGAGHGFYRSGHVRHGLPHAGEDHQGAGIGGNASGNSGACEWQLG